MKKFLVAIDQGTTSTRVILFDLEGNIKFTSQFEFNQYFPKNGWVEHNPNEIWTTTLKALKKVIKKASLLKGKILSIGITNQRETTVLWNKDTGEPVYKAIVWQDRRTVNYCKDLQKKGFTKKIQKITGLVIDSYFSATKIKWIIDNIESSKKLLKEDKLLFGTIDTWILWKLTEGRSHFTEATNASRTMLYDINKNSWSKSLLEIFNIPMTILPRVKDSVDEFGYTTLFGSKIKIGGIAGDQQAATIGQACFEPGSIKSTYGTGCFMIMNIGKDIRISKNNLLTTIAYRINGETTYALEGSIFIAGAAIQWLRDSLKIINSAEETEDLYKKNDKSQQVYLVPAFVGLGAPYWDGEARGAIFGMTRNTGVSELVKSAIDSVAYQTKDLIISMEKDSGIKINKIKVDGGMVKNEQSLQSLSNILLSECDRPKITETTSLGAAYLAGLSVGMLKNTKEISKKWQSQKLFKPKLHKKEVKYLYQGWLKAVNKIIVKKNRK